MKLKHNVGYVLPFLVDGFKDGIDFTKVKNKYKK